MIGSGMSFHNMRLFSFTPTGSSIIQSMKTSSSPELYQVVSMEETSTRH